MKSVVYEKTIGVADLLYYEPITRVGDRRKWTVLIEVNPKAADYFRRRKIFSTQEIRETKPDGSLIVSLKVGNCGEIRETLKMRLPNVRILEPERLRKDFFTEVQKWLSWQISSNVNMQA